MGKGKWTKHDIWQKPLLNAERSRALNKSPDLTAELAHEIRQMQFYEA